MFFSVLFLSLPYRNKAREKINPPSVTAAAALKQDKQPHLKSSLAKKIFISYCNYC